MKISDHLEQHATLLRIRQKWALRMAMVYVVLFAVFALGTIVLFSQPDHKSSIIDHGVVLPYIGLSVALAVQATEYRTLKGTLELLDVLQRATSENWPED